jgi:hypothetical protein
MSSSSVAAAEASLAAADAAQAAMMAEECILVDERDNIIGTQHKLFFFSFNLIIIYFLSTANL